MGIGAKCLTDHFTPHFNTFWGVKIYLRYFNQIRCSKRAKIAFIQNFLQVYMSELAFVNKTVDVHHTKEYLIQFVGDI